MIKFYLSNKKKEVINLNFTNKKDREFPLKALDEVIIYSKWDIIGDRKVWVGGRHNGIYLCRQLNVSYRELE